MNQANIAVWLSGAAYCGKDKYKTMHLAGPASQFVLSDILYDPKSDLQGYTGVIHSEKTMYIVFRGSSSILNWIDDLEFIKTPYLTYNECQCHVHKGFYSATTHVKNATIKSIWKLYKEYKYDNIIVTGHSLGAAISQLIAMELRAMNIKSHVLNFGQPRIGDTKYAEFVNTILSEQELYRITHNKDMVPHVPPIKMGFLHSCKEIFEDYYGDLTECNTCEDPMCADQFNIIHTNIDDHLIYLGHTLSCENSTII